jgi:hypothetical protein
MADDTSPRDSTTRDSTTRDIERGTPFDSEQRLMADPNAMHDDISRVQTGAHQTAEVAGEHTQNLLYEPGYVFDPRSSPHGVRYYPGPASGETEAEQR